MNDRRVPGTRAPQMMDYRCPACGTTQSEELRPQCPKDGTLMDPVESISAPAPPDEDTGKVRGSWWSRWRRRV